LWSFNGNLLGKNHAEIIINLSILFFINRKALDWAAFQGKPKLVRVLLEYGADVLNTNRFGQTPREVAERAGHYEVDILINFIRIITGMG
jgi:hypothetical protein